MSFKFDPNSTKNQGRWRLRDPNDFIKNKYITRKLKTGISYILGFLKDNNNKYIVQAIRFDKNIWTEKDAKIWWNENKYKYVKTWTQKDWDKLKEKSSSESSSESDEEKEEKEEKIDINQGIKLSKEISKILKIKYISPNKITINTKFKKDIIFPVGSIRRGFLNNNLKIKDIDLLLTKQIYKKDLNNIKEFTNFSGGEKRIDFDYKGVRINLFVFLNKNTFGSALLHSSGNFRYNMFLRRKLKKIGWKLSQNGLIDDKGNLVITKTEKELQDKIGVKNRLPYEREL